MRGLDKYVARVAAEERAQAAMGQLNSAIAKRDARRRARRSRPAPPVFTAFAASEFARERRPLPGRSQQDAARALIDECALLVSRTLHGLLVAPRIEASLVTEPGVDATMVPLAISDVPVALFGGTARVVSVRLWKVEPAPVFALCASEHATDTPPAALGLRREDHEALQAQAARMLGARLS